MSTRILLAILFALVVPSKVSALPIEWPISAGGNGHYYELIELIEGSTSWTAARDAAAAGSHLGFAGHLVTLTSAAEEEFVTSALAITSLPGYWIGAFQPVGSPEPSGNWQWITGEPFVYSHWAPTEPNNAGEDEGFAQLYGDLLGWNDDIDNGFTRGYLVEYPVPAPSGAIVLIALTVRFGANRRRESSA